MWPFPSITAFWAPGVLAAAALGAVGSVACGASEGGGKRPLVGDVSGTCFETGCFDGDDCTEDRCQANGVCLFVALNPENACQEDFHCNQGPCLTGTCEIDSCGNPRCNFDDVGFCMPCDSFGTPCNDGDPCTRDACDEPKGLCTFDAVDPRCLPWCSSSSALSAADAQWVGEGVFGPFRGRVVPLVSLCETGCECDQPMAVVEGGVYLRLLAKDDASPLTCRVSTCGETHFDCAPYAAGREYFVLGTTLLIDTTGKDAQAPGAPAEPPRAAANAIRVDSLCPSVNLEHGALLGVWSAHLERDGAMAELGLAISRTDISPTEITIVATIEACTGCEAMGLTLEPIRIDPIEPGLGVRLPLATGTADGRLFGDQGALVGELRTEDGQAFGTLRLEPVWTTGF